MKSQIFDCPRCNKKTTFVRKSNQTDGETIIMGIFTLGFAIAGREFWWKCTKCKYIIHE